MLALVIVGVILAIALFAFAWRTRETDRNRHEMFVVSLPEDCEPKVRGKAA